MGTLFPDQTSNHNARRRPSSLPFLMGSTRSKSSRAVQATTCLPAADGQQTPSFGVCALLSLLWQTDSEAVSRCDASPGFCGGDSWANYGSVRLRGSGETPQPDQSALVLQRLQLQVRGCEAKIQRLKWPCGT